MRHQPFAFATTVVFGFLLGITTWGAALCAVPAWAKTADIVNESHLAADLPTEIKPQNRASEMTFGLVTAGTFSTVSGKGDEELDGKMQLSPGVIAAYRTGHWGVDATALYLQRSQGVAAPDFNASIVTRWFQLSTVGRYYLNHVFSLGFGAYYAHTLGNADVTQDYTDGSGARVHTSSSQPYERYGILGHDAGLLTVIGASIPLDRNLRLILEGRYTHGLVAIDSTPSGDVYFRDLQAIVGVGFSI